MKEIDYHKYGDKINYSDKFCVEQKEDEEMEEKPNRNFGYDKKL